MISNTEQTETLIIGAGVFGASTAYHLSKVQDPRTITVIDRTSPPPSLAASNDINKIIRADYTDPFYCNLAYEALYAWSEWSELKPYYHRTGWVLLDEEGSDLSERIRKNFRDRGHDPTEDIELSEIETRWKGILKGTDTKGFRNAYWNPEAGWCEAADATASMMRAAIDRGVKYVQGEVLELRGENLDSVKVNTTGNQTIFTAKKIVLATGAWTSALLSPLEDKLDIPVQDRVERQVTAAGVVVAHYHMSEDEAALLSDMPVVVYGPHGEVIPPPRSNRLLKFTNAHAFTNYVTTKTAHKISVPPGRDQRLVPTQLKTETERWMMNRVMPYFTKGKSADYWRLCWDARTPTQDWLICRHPDDRLQHVYFAVGGSFHTYKFLPTAGKYVTSVLLGKSNGEEADRRFAWKKSDYTGRGAHEKTEPRGDLKDYSD